MAISNKTQIYLAGGFYQTYKKIVSDILDDRFRLYDPEKDAESHNIPGNYVGRDLGAIRMSHLVIAYQDTYPYVYGMAAEMGYAVAMNIPVIYVCTAPRVDSFLSGLARSTFSDLTAACEFVKARY